MQVKNIEGLSKDQLKQMINQGGKFVMFKYVVSVLVMTYRNTSDVYFIPPGKGTVKHHWGHTTLTGVMGWWGIPWGPIYTIGAMYSNMTGGIDVTTDVANQLGLNSLEGYNIPGTNSGTSESGSSTNNQGTGGYNIPR